VEGSRELHLDDGSEFQTLAATLPAATQMFHMRRSIEQIQEDFGVAPLFLMRGGGGFSRFTANHTARIAAELGFGLSETRG
jgi:hypothetical protein